MQLSTSGRVVTLVAVSQGRVFYATAGATSWTEAINNSGATPPLNFSGVVLSAANQQKLWFADGVNYVFYDPALNSVASWIASAGQLPADSQNNFPRLICTWRGRTVLSGLIGDPQDWFMSAVDDPTNFNYFPTPTVPTQAIAGDNAPQGLVGDVITALIPYSDDLLVFGGDHTIFMLNGDPMSGGQLDRVSDSIGIAFGQAWCRDPYGTLYFLSNKTGVYSMVPGQVPQRISQQIEQLLQPINTGEQIARMVWDDAFQGFHLFITTAANPQTTDSHFFYELRSGSWWQESFANNNHNPITTCTLDGNTAGDRVVLLGSWSGFVNFLDPSATDDDGTPINSSVVIGPLLTKDFDELLLKELVADLGATSGNVAFAVYVGPTAEIALASTPVATGTWQAGRNFANLIRRAGHAVYVRITASNPWSLERVRARLSTQGKVRARNP